MLADMFNVCSWEETDRISVNILFLDPIWTELMTHSSAVLEGDMVLSVSETTSLFLYQKYVLTAVLKRSPEMSYCTKFGDTFRHKNSQN